MIPLFLAVGACITVVSSFQIYRLSRSLGFSTVVLEPELHGATSIRCGFKIGKPVGLSLGYPMGKIEILDDSIVAHYPLGDFRFDRSSLHSIRVLSSGPPVQKIVVEFSWTSLTLLVSNDHDICHRLRSHGWTPIE